MIGLITAPRIMEKVLEPVGTSLLELAACTERRAPALVVHRLGCEPNREC